MIRKALASTQASFLLMNRTIASFLVAMLFFTTFMGYGQAEQSPLLLALSKGNHTLAIINPATLKVIARVPVGPDPHEVVASADGKTAYVTNTGGGRSYEINVIDLVAQKHLPDIDTRPLIERLWQVRFGFLPKGPGPLDDLIRLLESWIGAWAPVRIVRIWYM